MTLREKRETERERVCVWCVCVSYHIVSFILFHRSIQDYKIHMDMEMVIFIQVSCTVIKVYNSYMVHNIWLSQSIVYLACYIIKLWHAQNNRSLRNMRRFEPFSSYVFKQYVM
jgi:hypothetical protein